MRWVRETARGDMPAGLSMLAMLREGTGYVYYIAVIPSQRAAGTGGFLLDDALTSLKSAGANEVLACIRPDNAPSVRLFQSRDFRRTTFRELVRGKGLANAAALWMRMVVAPGEKVFTRVFRD